MKGSRSHSRCNLILNDSDLSLLMCVLSARLEAELAAAANQPLPDDEDELLDS